MCRHQAALSFSAIFFRDIFLKIPAVRPACVPDAPSQALNSLSYGNYLKRFGAQRHD